eukprot:366311-Chlamydomonas_euryale.AAC.9
MTALQRCHLLTKTKAPQTHPQVPQDAVAYRGLVQGGRKGLASAGRVVLGVDPAARGSRAGSDQGDQ